MSKNINRYLDPKTGYWGKSKMLKKFKGKDGHLLRRMYSLQRHREINAPMKRKLFRYETAPYPFYSVQIDLAFLPKLRSPLNKNVWGFIVVIDVFSRYLWVKTFTTREALHFPLEEVIQQMQEQFGQTPRNMTGDNEFATTRMQALAGKYDFKWYFGDAHEKFRTGIAERVIRTIKNLIKRYVVQNNTTRYIDVLPDLVDNYNNTIHRTIGTTPYKAITTLQRNVTREPRSIPALNENTRVRILENRFAFTKGDTPYYSKNVYEIVGRDRNRYVLRNINSDIPLSKRYGRHQLYVLKNDVIQDRYLGKSHKLKDRLGYDKGVKENARRNALSKELHKLGVKNVIDDPIERQEQALHEYQLLPQEEAEYLSNASDSDGVRVDELDKKWDKLSVNAWVIMPTNENGACFFNSIAGLIHWQKSNKIIKPGSSEETNTARFLRKQIVNKMKQMRNKKIPEIDETFEENISRQLQTENDNRSVDKYLSDMLKTSEWAGQSEIIACSLYLKRNILVFVKRNNFYIKHGGFVLNSNDNNILTLFWNQRNPYTEGNHYEYLLPASKKPRRSRRLVEKQKKQQLPLPLPQPVPEPQPQPLSEIDILKKKIRNKQALSEKYTMQGKYQLANDRDNEIKQLQSKLQSLQSKNIVNQLKGFGKNVNIPQQSDLSQLISNLQSEQPKSFLPQLNLNRGDNISDLIAQLQ